MNKDKEATFLRYLSARKLPIPEEVKPIASLISEAGGVAYLVGGSVRDTLLSIEPKDFDIEVHRIYPDELIRILSQRYTVNLVGNSFGVLKLKGLPIDVSIPRRETKRGTGHKGFEIESDPYLPIRHALSRRDFTINAIALNLHTGRIVDPFGGMLDLYRGVLDPVSKRFKEDPLRVLRAMQFIARFKMFASDKLIRYSKEMVDEFDALPKERVFEEFRKLILKGEEISSGLWFLFLSGWLRHFPEIAQMFKSEQDPIWHPEGDVFRHTCLSLDYFAQNCRDLDEESNLVVGLAILCHDMGKPETATLNDHGRIINPKHDLVGVEKARTFLQRITNETALFDGVLPLVERHMAFYPKEKYSDARLRRLLASVDFWRLIRVVKADDIGRYHPDSPESKKNVWLYDELEARAKEMEDRQEYKPIIMGRHLITLGLTPGPAFRSILDACLQAQLDGQFSTLEDGMRYLQDVVLTDWKLEGKV